MFLIAAAMTQAAVPNPDIAYTFAETAGNLIDHVASYDSTADTGVNKTNACIRGNCWDCNGGSITMPVAILDGKGTFTINMWYDWQGPPAGYILGGRRTATQEAKFFVNAGTFYLRMTDDSGNENLAATYVPVAGRDMISMTYDGAVLCGFKNATLQGCTAMTGTASVDSALRLCSQYNGANGGTGLLDEVYIWNRNLTTQELTDIFNDGTGLFCTGDPCLYTPLFDPVNLSDASKPTNNQVMKATTISVNTTGNFSATKTINATLYINGTYNKSKIETAGMNQLVDFTLSNLRSGTYTYKINVSARNADGSLNYSEATTTKTFIIHPDLTISFNIDYDNLYVGYNVTMNCSVINPTVYEHDVIYWINNTQNNKLTNQSSNKYKLQLADLFDTLKMWCTVNTSYVNYTSTKNTTAETIDTLFTFRALNYKSVLLQGMIMDLGTGDQFTTNPATAQASNFLNASTRKLNTSVNISDTGYGNRNYSSTVLLTENSSVYNFTLLPNKLILGFYKLGALTATQGYIADMNKSRNWTNSSIIYIQQDLTEGYVHVRFGMTNGANWTQYYEYYNDLETHIDDDLELLAQADWSAYFQVLDYTNSPIRDAIVRVEFSYHAITNGTSWVYHKPYSQRLTDDEGYTFVFADSRTEVLITVTKDGYNPYQMLLTIGDESFTKAQALKIYLQESDSGVEDNAWVYIQRSFINRSLNLKGTVMAIGRDKVEVTTSYRTAQGLGRKDISNLCDQFYRCPFTLYSNTDFKLVSSDDVEVSIYLDDVLWKTVTVSYDDEEKQYQFTGISSLVSSTIFNPLLYIMLILISLGMGAVLSNTGVSESVFKIGAVLLAFISTQFLWLCIIIIISYILKALRRVISE